MIRMARVFLLTHPLMAAAFWITFASAGSYGEKKEVLSTVVITHSVEKHFLSHTPSVVLHYLPSHSKCGNTFSVLTLPVWKTSPHTILYVCIPLCVESSTMYMKLINWQTYTNWIWLEFSSVYDSP